MSEWAYTTLREVFDVRDGTHDSPKRQKQGFKLVTTKHLKGGQLDLESAYFISEKDFIEVNRRSQVNRHDILISMIGTVGEIFRVDGESDFAIKNLGLIKCGDKSSSLWTYYWLLSPQAQNEIKSRCKGTTQEFLSLGELRKFPLPTPSKAEQEAIAEVLSSLDDKIDLLKRQNNTLEGMAEALFRQWFIEEAQEDWEEVEFNTIAENVRNVMKPENLQGDVRLVGLEHFDSKSLVLNRYEQTNELGSQKYKFEKGQIMFGKLRPYFHNISLPFFSGVCSTDILIIEARDDVWTIFAFFFLNQDWVVEAATQSASGTRMPRTNWNFLGSLTVLLPEVESLSEFNTIARPMIEKIEKNWSEIRILNQQRDTLLPKLMSGEVRVQMD